MFKLIVREELDMASADRSTLFINATVLDGSEHMEPQPDMAVAVERGVITWMGPSAVAQVPAGAEVWQVRISCQVSSICMCICAVQASRFRRAMRAR